MVTALAAAGLSGPVLALDTVWLGGDGNWSDGSKWSLGQPGMADVAILDSGAAVLNFNTIVSGLNLSSALSGTGQLTLTGSSNWSGGTQFGSGVTTYSGRLAITGDDSKIISRLINAGNTTWSGNTAVNTNGLHFNGGTFNNTGSFVDANAYDSGTFGSAGIFKNSGTYTKQTNTLTSIGAATFNNSGTVNVKAGTLQLASGGSSTGTYAIAAGAKLVLTGQPIHVLNSVTTSGLGKLEINGGAQVYLNGGTHTTAFVLSGGTLTGTTHTIGGAATWTAGNIVGSGSDATNFGSSFAITGDDSKLIGRIVNAGNTTWSGNTAANTNGLHFNGGTFNNTGSFVDANAYDSGTFGSAGIFNNSGTYTKQTNTLTSIGAAAFNNSGTVNVKAGTLQLASGGTSTGTYAIAAGAKLLLSGQPIHILNSVTTTGLGTLEISSGAQVYLNGGTHTTAFVLSGGTLTGTTHTIGGAATWTAGNIVGSGSDATNFGSSLAITGDDSKLIGRIVNAGNTTWSGNTAANTNGLHFNGGTFNNIGSFVDANAYDSGTFGGSGTFNNGGTYTKQTNTLTSINHAFSNTGTVNVKAGTLQVNTAFINRGIVNVASGASFVGNGESFVNAGTLSGNGTVSARVNGTIVNQGSISPGNSIGHLTLNGNLTETTTGVLSFELASLASFDTLVVTDDVTLAGALVVRNAGYIPVVGDSFLVMTFGERLAGSVFDAVTTVGYGDGIVFGADYGANDVRLRVMSAAAVPEPGAWALLLSGILVVGLFARRRVAG